MGAARAKIWQDAGRCSEPLCDFSRRFTPWCGRQRSSSKTARPFQETREVSRVALDFVGQLLGQASNAPQLSRLRRHHLQRSAKTVMMGQEAGRTWRENIERPTSNTERPSERRVALPFDVRRWMFDVGCSSGFMGSAQGFLIAHRSHEPRPSPALRAPSPPRRGRGMG